MTVLCSNKVAYISGNAVTLPPAIMERQPSSLELKQIWRWKGPWYWSTTRKKTKLFILFTREACKPTRIASMQRMLWRQESIFPPIAFTSASSSFWRHSVKPRTFSDMEMAKNMCETSCMLLATEIASHTPCSAPPYCATKGEEPAWQKLSEVCNELGGTVWTPHCSTVKGKNHEEKTLCKIGSDAMHKDRGRERMCIHVVRPFRT